VQLFKSRSEMPSKLRGRMQKALNSPEAATILIVDRRGRSEVMKLLRGEPSILRTNGPASVRGGASVTVRRGVKARLTPALPAWLRPRWVRALIAFLLPALAGAGFYALLTSAK